MAENSIYRNGLTEEIVEDLKKEYGDIYATEYDDVVFVWRPINRKEYREIVVDAGNGPLDREEAICQLCVLWPKGYNFSDGKAGYAALLSQNIMDESGFLAAGPVVKL